MTELQKKILEIYDKVYLSNPDIIHSVSNNVNVEKTVIIFNASSEENIKYDDVIDALVKFRNEKIKTNKEKTK